MGSILNHFDVFILAAIAIFFIFTLKTNNPINHDAAYRKRRFFNWFLLGLTYAFLYMGRYNLTVAKMAFGDLMTNEAFGAIFGVGAWVYALSFLFNGPLTDKLGGRFSILLSAFGSACMNAIMGVLTYYVLKHNATMSLTLPFIVLYGLNMYFQSLGALSIVKVNSYWFHIKERGVLGGLFGILISLGLYFAFDWCTTIINATLATPKDPTVAQTFIRSILVGSDPITINQTWWVFFIPSLILFGFFIADFFIIRDKPSDAGHKDFDCQDASSGDTEEKVKVFAVLAKVLSNPIIITICIIEFCSGVLRNGIMQWYPIYMKEINGKLGASSLDQVTFFKDNWGLLLMLAGVLGGVFAGFISDKLFNSRRGPVTAFLYAGMLVTSVILYFSIESYYILGMAAVFGSLCVIGVHGMLSGTATMDFGGRKGAATAVGIVDGAVYLGTGLQAVAIGFITTKSWNLWPLFLIPFALLGLVLAIKIWQAFPNATKKASH